MVVRAEVLSCSAHGSGLDPERDPPRPSRPVRRFGRGVRERSGPTGSAIPVGVTPLCVL
ncbi:hypothetical protein B005_3980 [Nocardiopsis alba ATCC BAA-2165]|uniref:Uncharacterized protein n=1 Tax=Nocardiopsis alba (strain ATCC BAA-2165 / BE74) TaxID=1205910 RepID=J7L748_NOCAA|nr:hypothetical protein B005_3980 [Nocardiopsis alba ATCC BAA-2165]